MRPAKHLRCTPHASSLGAAFLFAAILFSLVDAAQTKAQSVNSFHWLSPTANAATWTKIQNAFRGELQPDAARTDGSTAFGYKFLERVGLIDHSALVIVTHKTSQNPKEEDGGQRFSSAFGFNLETGVITRIGHADEMWHWKFKRLAQFERDAAPDVAFTYLSCWECEPVELLSTIYYDAANKTWAMREWQMDKMIWWTGRDGLVVDADILEGADDTVSFTCLYGVLDLRGARKENVA